MSQAGVYTIEATTFYRHRDSRPQRTTGAYTLTVSVDHTPRAAGQPVELRVENGTEVTSAWNYRPGAAAVQIASAFPEGIDAAVEVTSRGRATLSATPSAVGQYAVLVTYANGTAALTKATTIDSYCPDGQDELPAGCGTPLRALMKRPGQIIVSPLPEHIVNLAQDCYRTSPSGEPDEWLCRRLQESRVYISKTSDQIEGTSDAHVDYGT